MPPNTHAKAEGAANGHDPPSSKKGKQKKAIDPNDTSKLVAAKISQLEQDAAGEKDQAAEIDREVRKANRELTNQISKMTNPTDKIDFILKRCSELLADMRRVERKQLDNKKHADMLQKEKDVQRQELAKANTFKEKLEKLCRELQRDNNKLKSDHKQLQSQAKSNFDGVDERMVSLLAKLDGYQDEKDGQSLAAVKDVQLEEAYRSRFKSFMEQYEVRELYFHAQMRVKELEVHYHLSRYERERKRAEDETSQSRSLKEELKKARQREEHLKASLNVFAEQFQFKQARTTSSPSTRTTQSKTSDSPQLIAAPGVRQVDVTVSGNDEALQTLRREMEEATRRSKRLEKENETHRRKHDTTSSNIITMAQERADLKVDRDSLRQKLEAEKRRGDKLQDIIRGMQEQGRKIPPAAASAIKSLEAEYGESTLSDEEEDEDEDASDEYDDDDDSDDDRPLTLPPRSSIAAPALRPYGPERPPPRPQPTINGH